MKTTRKKTTKAPGQTVVVPVKTLRAVLRFLDLADKHLVRLHAHLATMRPAHAKAR